MYPKVSIQIPTYNQQEFIQRTIESCLMQDYANLEINIADDNSTDDTGKIVRAYLINDKVRYFKNETNIGRVANYRKALYEHATGEWALNLDGDDYLTDQHFISNAVSAIASSAENDVVIYQANQDIEKIKEVFPGSLLLTESAILVDGRDFFSNYFKILNFYHCATLYKRSEALKLDFYSFDCLFTDFNSIAKLFLKGQIIFSGKQVAHWSKHEQNESATLDEKNIANEIAAVNELANFAQQYLPAKVVKKWRTKMSNFFIYIYQDMQTANGQKPKVLNLLLKNGDMSILYVRQCLKAFLNILWLHKKKSGNTKINKI